MLTDYTIVNLIGDIFKYIGIAFKFVGSVIGAGYNLFINTTSSICGFLGILGISSQPLKIALTGLVGVSLLAVVSLVPDVISYFACRLSKKYRKLTTKEAKREYRIKHTHFLLRAILATRNLASKRKATKNAKKMEKRNKKVAKQNERVRQASNIVDQILEEAPPVIVNPPEPDVHEVEITDVNAPNIKILYASDILGKMLRNGTAVQRRMSATNKPVLVDFSAVPTEVLTGNQMGQASGISFHKKIDGADVNYHLDDPNFLADTRLYDLPASKDELVALRETLVNDPKYQANLNRFFNSHQKALRR